MTHNETALALIDAASFISRRDDSEYWNISCNSWDGVTITMSLYETMGEYDYDKGDSGPSVSAAENMARMRKSLGGRWTKDADDYSYSLTRSLSEHVTLKLTASRADVCEPKVVGQETVEVKDYDNCPTKTVTRDIVEYDCKPILS